MFYFTEVHSIQNIFNFTFMQPISDDVLMVAVTGVCVCAFASESRLNSIRIRYCSLLSDFFVLIFSVLVLVCRFSDDFLFSSGFSNENPNKKIKWIYLIRFNTQTNSTSNCIKRTHRHKHGRMNNFWNKLNWIQYIQKHKIPPTTAIATAKKYLAFTLCSFCWKYYVAILCPLNRICWFVLFVKSGSGFVFRSQTQPCVAQPLLSAFCHCGRN